MRTRHVTSQSCARAALYAEGREHNIISLRRTIDVIGFYSMAFVRHGLDAFAISHSAVDWSTARIVG